MHGTINIKSRLIVIELIAKASFVMEMEALISVFTRSYCDILAEPFESGAC